MKFLKHYLFFLLISAGLACTDTKPEIEAGIIPQPQSVVLEESFSGIHRILIEQDENPELEVLSTWLSNNNLPLDLNINEGANTSISKSEDGTIGSYSLEISEKNIDIVYTGIEGLRNAFSSLLQLYLLNDSRLPIIKIEDEPRFSYRGMHLDVGRHFFPVSDIKKYIDYLAFYKYNYFHWHLTEDQGWRIEINKWPKLHEVGGFRSETLVGHYNDQPHTFDGKRYGGYYTQEEAKEIVSYATARGVEVIPEIELPGHSLAALAAYPQLACEEKDYEVGTKWGVYSDVYCPTEFTFQLLQDVFDEIIPIFPSSYIHIGGDECPKTAWKKSSFCQNLIKEKGLKDEHGLQSYFIQRIEKYLNSKDKKIIGWDEILEGGLAPNATVMSWRGEEGGIEAAKASHDVIMTPTSHCYFDYYQSEHPDEPLAIGGYLPYDKVYNWKVIPAELPESSHKYILGGQGNIWTEYLPTFDLVEYMGLTRMVALSEVLWTEEAARDFPRFNEHLLSHIQYWKSKSVRIANHLLDASADVKVKAGEGVYVSTFSRLKEDKKYVQAPTSQSFESWNENELKLDQGGKYLFYHEYEEEKGRTLELIYEPHLGNTAAIELLNPPAAKYSGNGAQSVINGILGNDDRYGGSEWLGFEGSDFEATLDFQEARNIQSLKFRFFKGEGQWIYLPAGLKLFGSDDGKSYIKLVEETEITSEGKIAELKIELDGYNSRFLKIHVDNYGVIPADRQGGGHEAWLFVDEIVIQ